MAWITIRNHLNMDWCNLSQFWTNAFLIWYDLNIMEAKIFLVAKHSRTGWKWLGALYLTTEMSCYRLKSGRCLENYHPNRTNAGVQGDWLDSIDCHYPIAGEFWWLIFRSRYSLCSCCWLDGRTISRRFLKSFKWTPNFCISNVNQLPLSKWCG